MVCSCSEGGSGVRLLLLLLLLLLLQMGCSLIHSPRSGMTLRTGRVSSFIPCHFYTSVSNFRMFGHMLCYLISVLFTNKPVWAFTFRNLMEMSQCCGLL